MSTRAVSTVVAANVNTPLLTVNVNRRSWSIYNPGPKAIDIYFDGGVVISFVIASTGYLLENATPGYQGNVSATVEGGGPQNVNVTEEF